MSENLIRYLLLQYSPTTANEGFRLLIAESQPGGSLEVHPPPHWERLVQPCDLDYLNALIHDWQHASFDQISILLHELSRLSQGPLRAIECNLATSAECRKLKDALIG